MAGKVTFFGGHADPLASAEQYIESISMEAGSAHLYMEAELGEQGFEPAPTGVVVGTPVGASTPADSTEGNTPLSVSGAAEISQGEVKEVIAPASEGGYTDNLNGDASTPEASGQVGTSEGSEGSHDDSGESAIANIESAVASITAAAEEHGVSVESVEVTENSDGTATVEVEVAPEASAPAATEEAAPATEAPAEEAAPAEAVESGEHDDSGESAIGNIEEAHGNVGAAAEEHDISGEEAAPAEEAPVEEEKPAEEPKEEEKEEDKE